jgi:hypothetical protein
MNFRFLLISTINFLECPASNSTKDVKPINRWRGPERDLCGFFAVLSKCGAFCAHSFINQFRTYNQPYLLTYSKEQSPSWEANRFAASQEIPRTLWNPKVHHRARHLSLPWARSTQSIFPHPTSTKSFLILQRISPDQWHLYAFHNRPFF